MSRRDRTQSGQANAPRQRRWPDRATDPGRASANPTALGQRRPPMSRLAGAGRGTTARRADPGGATRRGPTGAPVGSARPSSTRRSHRRGPAPRRPGPPGAAADAPRSRRHFAPRALHRKDAQARLAAEHLEERAIKGIGGVQGAVLAPWGVEAVLRLPPEVGRFAVGRSEHAHPGPGPLYEWERAFVQVGRWLWVRDGRPATRRPAHRRPAPRP